MSKWTEVYIKECKINLTWSDGAVEPMSFFDLPEVVQDELRTYLVEVEQLRNEDKQAYDNEYITKE